MGPQPNITDPNIKFIEADHLNELVIYYNEYWNDPVIGGYTFDTNHSTGSDDRRFGWGQTAASISPTPQAFFKDPTTGAVTEGTKVTIDDMDQLIAQVNAGLYHKEDNPATPTYGLYPLSNRTVDIQGSLITKTLFNDVSTKIETLNTNKYKTDWLNLNTSVLQTTSTSDWSQDLEIVHKFEFNNYNEARYFFNAGGELTLELSMAAGGTTGNQVWQQIFDQFDSIRIGAEACKVVGDAVYDVITTSGINKGFYTGILYSATPTFETILDAGVFAYVSSDTATVYLESEYNSRRIRLKLKADEQGGKFNVYVKVILIEDVDDDYDITAAITLTSGYAQPSTTPGTSDNNGNIYMTVGSNSAVQFIARAAPDIALEGTGWIEVDAEDGEQLEDFIDGSTNWTFDSGYRYTKNP